MCKHLSCVIYTSVTCILNCHADVVGLSQNNDATIAILINNELNLQIVLKVIQKFINSKKGTICDTPL